MTALTELKLKLNQFSTAILTKVNGKLGKTEQAADSAKVGGKTPQQVVDQAVAAVDAKLDRVNGRVGQLPFFAEDGTPMAFIASEMMLQCRMGDNDTDIAALKATTVSFADVFNKWDRISHNATLTFPANVTEMNSWSYDNTTQSVASTVNSGSLIGLISLDRFKSYTFETVIKSTNNDDDAVGVCAAFRKNGAREYTLAVMVSPGGVSPDASYRTAGNPKIWCTLNFNQGTANGQVVLWEQEFSNIRSAWNTAGSDVANGVRVKLTKTEAGKLRIQAFKKDGSAWPTPVDKTIDVPDMFKGECAIGYLAMSQPAATWENLQVPTKKTDIIDTRDMSVIRWDTTTGAWSTVGKASDLGILDRGRMYRNSVAPFGTYYLDLEGQLVTVGTPSTGRTVAVNEYVTVAVDAIKQYDLSTILAAQFAKHDIKSAEIVVRAKDTNGASPMNGAYANAEAFVSYGVKDERYIVVANQSGASIDLYVKVTVQAK